MGGASHEEKELQRLQAKATQIYLDQQTQLYGQQQQLLQFLTPILEDEIKNPTGFSAEEMATLNASNVNTTGAQYANVQKQLNLVNASRNMAGLTSGVAAAQTAALQGAAAGTVATNAANVELASAQLKEQKKSNAEARLLALQSGLGGQAVSMGQVETTSEKNAFDQAYTIQQQDSSLLQSILGGALGAGASFLTGGMSNILGGGSFLKPA